MLVRMRLPESFSSMKMSNASSRIVESSGNVIKTFLFFFVATLLSYQTLFVQGLSLDPLYQKKIIFKVCNRQVFPGPTVIKLLATVIYKCP
jgi:hypothetical protein